MYFVIFLLGIAFSIKNFVGYSHLMEFMGHRVSFLTGLLYFCDSLIFIITPLIILFATKNLQVLVILAIFLTLIVLCISYINHFPESIKYNLSAKNFYAAKKDAMIICDINKASHEERK